MKTRNIVFASAAVLGLAVAVPLVATAASADDWNCPRGFQMGANGPAGGYGSMGQRGQRGGKFMGRHGGQQQAMMGNPDFAGRKGYGRMGGRATADLELTNDQVKDLMEARLIRMGNKNLKVGPIADKDGDSVSVQIVTKDGSLVQDMTISRKTGRPVWAQ